MLFFLKCFLYTQAQEDITKNLTQMKNMLYGSGETEPQNEIVVAQLAQELYNSNLLLLLIQNLNRIEFEVRSPAVSARLRFDTI